MTIRLATAAQAAYDTKRNEALDSAFNLTDAGSGAGTVKVYSGAQPASANDAATGTLLATFTLADPAWSAASALSKALDADPDLSASTVAAGTPGWARVADSTGATVFDGSVGLSGTDFITATSPWASGQTVNLTTGSITVS